MRAHRLASLAALALLAGPALTGCRSSPTAAEVVSLMVLQRVGARIVAERGLSAGPRAGEEFAAIFGLPASDAYGAQQTLAAAASDVTINPRYGGLVLPAVLRLPSGPVPIDIAFPGDGKVPVEEA